MKLTVHWIPAVILTTKIGSVALHRAHIETITNVNTVDDLRITVDCFQLTVDERMFSAGNSLNHAIDT